MAKLYQQYQPAIQAPYMQFPYGARWGASFGSIKDQLLQRTIMGVLARFPSFAPLDALGEIGIERGIEQGINETTPHYIQRLLNACGEWSIGGTYWGLLAQLYGAGYTTAYIVAANGYVYGPSNGVVAPDPINGLAGTPPAFTQLPPWYTDGSAPTSMEWATDTVYPFGSVVTPSLQPGTYFIAIVGGTSSSVSEPTWPGVGGTVVDGTVKWAYVGNYTNLPYYVPWNFNSANGQGDPETLVVSQGQSLGGPPSPDGSFWSRFVVMFDPYPGSWTDVVNPPTNTTSPTLSEISLISDIIMKWKPGKSTCVGILALASGVNNTWAWPLATTTNIDFSCWLSRAISGGDAPTNTALVATSPEAVNSWLPNTAMANAGGSTYVFTVPSEAYLVANPSYRYVYTTPTASFTTGYTEPSWPTTIGGTVTDNGTTWTCSASLYIFSSGDSSTVFQLQEL